MDNRITAFLNVLDTNDSTTGGGTASAVAGAMAAGLAAMVARLSPGKAGMEPEEFYHGRKAALDDLSQALFSGGLHDSEAFAAVKTAYSLPKASPEEKEARQLAVQSAWIQATEVPLTNAEKCGEVLLLAAGLVGRSNENAASDLDCARYLAYAGLLGCLQNVKINIPMIKNEAVAAEFSSRTESIQAVAAQARPEL